jgi:hypothetical protein
VTKVELARELKISVRMVDKLRQLGMPCDDLAAAAAWRRMHIDGRHAGKRDATFAEDRAATQRIKRRLAELDLSRREGKVWDQALACCVGPVGAIRDRIQGLPLDLAARFPGELSPAVIKQAQQFVDDWLAALSADIADNERRLTEE